MFVKLIMLIYALWTQCF